MLIAMFLITTSVSMGFIAGQSYRKDMYLSTKKALEELMGDKK